MFGHYEKTLDGAALLWLVVIGKLHQNAALLLSSLNRNGSLL
jgi:hypothetical protein